MQYEKKIAQLEIMLSDLNNICERATQNSLYSQWHINLLNETIKLVEEINTLAKEEGKPNVNVDFSKYAFNPIELRIEGLTKSYDDYIFAKSLYDSKIFPDYQDILLKYYNKEITTEEYEIYAKKIADFLQILKDTRYELLENIRTAITDDYQERPKHEVDEFLKELEIYNTELKEYNKLYKNWNLLKDTPGKEVESNDAYKKLSAMAESLQLKRPGLVKKRGLIYNPKTLTNLNIQKNMLETVIRDSININDTRFIEKKELYETKLSDIKELIKEIEKFRNSIKVGKIKPLEPIQTIADENNKNKGGTGKQSGTKTKPPVPNPVKREPKKKYEFETIDEPGFLLEETKEPKQTFKKYYNLEELIAKIQYGNPPDFNIHYSKMDNFVYMNKDARIVNFPKSHGVTLLDKPIKLLKVAFSSIVVGTNKLIAKAAYKNERIRNNIDGLQKRINELTDDEIEFILDNFDSNKMTELSKVIPEVAMSLLNNRLMIHYNFRLEKFNKELFIKYKEIIDKYNRYTEIINLLKSDKLTEEERTNLIKEQKTLDIELCKAIIEHDEIRKEANKINKGGVQSFLENWKVRHNASLGGRNISKKYEEDAIKTYNFTNIANHVRNGNGYLAAKDFLYGEKLKIESTKTERKARNWFFKTRTGAYEFKPFVGITDYTKDTYVQDVFSTIALVANIANLMYVRHLEAELLVAKQQVNLLNNRINEINKEIAIVNEQIIANNKAISELKEIGALYTSDPEQFVEKMVAFANTENAKTHAYTEYATQMADAGKAGTLRISSDGSFYKTFDKGGHIFSQETVDEINKITKSSLPYEEQAKEIGNVLRGIDQYNVDKVIPAVKMDALNYLKLTGSNQWSFNAFEYYMTSASTLDSSFVPDVFEAFVNAALKTNDLSVINNVTGLSLTSVSSISTLPNITLIPAIVSLSTLVGKEMADSIIDRYNQNQTLEEKFNLDEKTQELADEIKGIEMDVEKEAKRIYEERMKEWNSKGPFYRLKNRKTKPNMYQAYAEAKQQSESLGRGL